MKFFIFGSRDTTNIKFDKYDQMMNWLKENNHTVITGDCYGIDSKIQEMCITYNVPCEVYHIGSSARNSNGLKTKKIEGNKYIDKDIAMCNDCDIAIAILNGTSKGSLRNIEQLKSMKKQVIIRR